MVARTGEAERADRQETGADLVGQGGRPLGARAQETRRRLLTATAELLEEQRLRDVRVIDIARKVETSPATFYQYFKDVEDAVLCLTETAADETASIVEMIKGSWDGEEGMERARGIVDVFIRHWDHHGAVLRVRNLASDEGDERFLRSRMRSMAPVLEALAAQVEESQRAGKVRAADSSHATAAAMAAILERLAAYHRELELVGVTRADLVETSAHILYRTVTGSN